MTTGLSQNPMRIRINPWSRLKKYINYLIANIGTIIPDPFHRNIIIIDDGAGNYIRIPKLTTAERNALTPVNGMLVYDKSLNLFYKYENGAWSTFTTSGFTGAGTGITTITGTGGQSIDIQTADIIKLIRGGGGALALTTGGPYSLDIQYNTASRVFVSNGGTSIAGYCDGVFGRFSTQVGTHDGYYWRNFLTLAQGLNHQMNYIPDTALIALGSTILNTGIGLISNLNQGLYTWDTEYNAWTVAPTIGNCGYRSYYKIYGPQTLQCEFKKPLGNSGVGTNCLIVGIFDQSGDNTALLECDPGHPTKFRISTRVAGVSYVTLDNITLDITVKCMFQVKSDSVSTRYYFNGTLIATETTHKLPIVQTMYCYCYSNDTSDILTVYEMDHVIGVL